ncbi:MAG: ArnT family glycosyltransferase [Acidobacteriota bacterium]
MEDPGRGGRVPAFILALGLVASFCLFSFGFTEGLTGRSEGRYASLAAAMARSGDYLVPRLDGIRHFEKPPLSIWAMAFSLRTFGESEWALRLPGILAALCGLVAAYLLAGGGGSWMGMWALFLAAASPLYFLLARSATTDIYLAAFSALTLFFSARALERGKDTAGRSRDLNLATLMAALGFLTKGPIIWILTLGPLGIEMAWSRIPGEMRSLFSWRRILLFTGVVAPWFLAVGYQNPGLLGWFIRERTVGALVSSRDFHPGPWYYYAPFLFLGFLPAVIILGAAGREGWRGLLASRRHRLLLNAIVFPLVVLSLSASKLPAYVLPLVVPMAVLAAAVMAAGHGRRGIVGAAGGSLVLLLGAARVTWRKGWVGKIAPGDLQIFAAAAFLLVAGSLVAAGLALARREKLGGALLVAFQMGALAWSFPALARATSPRPIALEAGRLASDGQPIICYQTLVRSLPFYTGRDVYVVRWHSEARVSEAERAGVYLETPEEFRALLSQGPAVVISNPQRVEDLLREVGPLRRIREKGRFVLFTSDQGAGRAQKEGE